MSKERFHVLDGLRGVAAMAVLLHHIGVLRGHIGIGSVPWLFPRGNLAVDFFFLLSGFVISHSYDDKLAAGFGFIKYARVRLTRLYPTMFYGIVLGFCVSSISPEINSGFMLAFATQIFFIPFVISPEMFPLNNAQWSLFFEFVANAIYASCHRFIRGVTLICVVIVSGTALVLAIKVFGTIAIGYKIDNFIGGFPRVSFSFFLGVLLFRSSCHWRRVAPGVPFYIAAPALLLLLGIPNVDLPLFRSGTRDIVCVFVIFPIVLMLCVNSKDSAKIAEFLGSMSYPLYAIHIPLLLASGAAIFVIAEPNSQLEWALWGVSATAIMACAAWLARAIRDKRKVEQGERTAFPADDRSPA